MLSHFPSRFSAIVGDTDGGNLTKAIQVGCKCWHLLSVGEKKAAEVPIELRSGSWGTLIFHAWRIAIWRIPRCPDVDDSSHTDGTRYVLYPIPQLRFVNENILNTDTDFLASEIRFIATIQGINLTKEPNPLRRFWLCKFRSNPQGIVWLFFDILIFSRLPIRPWSFELSRIFAKGLHF